MSRPFRLHDAISNASALAPALAPAPAPAPAPVPAPAPTGVARRMLAAIVFSFSLLILCQQRPTRLVDLSNICTKLSFSSFYSSATATTTTFAPNCLSLSTVADDDDDDDNEDEDDEPENRWWVESTHEDEYDGRMKRIAKDEKGVAPYGSETMARVPLSPPPPLPSSSSSGRPFRGARDEIEKLDADADAEYDTEYDVGDGDVLTLPESALRRNRGRLLLLRRRRRRRRDHNRALLSQPRERDEHVLVAHQNVERAIGSEGHADTDVHSDPAPRSHIYGDADADGDGDADADADADAGGDAYGDGDADAYGDGDVYADAYGDGDEDADDSVALGDGDDTVAGPTGDVSDGAGGANEEEEVEEEEENDDDREGKHSHSGSRGGQYYYDDGGRYYDPDDPLYPGLADVFTNSKYQTAKERADSVREQQKIRKRRAYWREYHNRRRRKNKRIRIRRRKRIQNRPEVQTFEEVQTKFDAFVLDLLPFCGDNPDGSLTRIQMNNLQRALAQHFDEKFACDPRVDEKVASVTILSFVGSTDCYNTEEGDEGGDVQGDVKGSDGTQNKSSEEYLERVGAEENKSGGGGNGSGRLLQRGTSSGRNQQQRQRRRNSSMQAARSYTCTRCTVEILAEDRHRARKKRTRRLMWTAAESAAAANATMNNATRAGATMTPPPPPPLSLSLSSWPSSWPSSWSSLLSAAPLTEARGDANADREVGPADATYMPSLSLSLLLSSYHSSSSSLPFPPQSWPEPHFTDSALSEGIMPTMPPPKSTMVLPASSATATTKTTYNPASAVTHDPATAPAIQRTLQDDMDIDPFPACKANLVRSLRENGNPDIRSAEISNLRELDCSVGSETCSDPKSGCCGAPTCVCPPKWSHPTCPYVWRNEENLDAYKFLTMLRIDGLCGDGQVASDAGDGTMKGTLSDRGRDGIGSFLLQFGKDVLEDRANGCVVDSEGVELGVELLSVRVVGFREAAICQEVRKGEDLPLGSGSVVVVYVEGLCGPDVCLNQFPAEQGGNMGFVL